MRLNLFASSLILASSLAIVPKIDEDAYILAQVEASAEWRADGRHTVKYRRPADHCCQVYKGEKFTKPLDEQFCWKPDEQFKGNVRGFDPPIKGIDCGKNTWVELHGNMAGYYFQFAGRMS